MSRATKSLLWWLVTIALIVVLYLTVWQSSLVQGLPDIASWLLRVGTAAAVIGLASALNPFRPAKEAEVPTT